MDAKTIGLIISLAAPLAVAPVLVMLTRGLFALFIREGAELFIGLEMHKLWSLEIARDIALVNGVLFTLAWWAAVGINCCEIGAFAVAAPFIIALGLALLLTTMFIKARLRLEPGDAFLVGLLAFAGGNLPLIILLPALVMLAMAK